MLNLLHELNAERRDRRVTEPLEKFRPTLLVAISNDPAHRTFAPEPGFVAQVFGIVTTGY